MVILPIFSWRTASMSHSYTCAVCAFAMAFGLLGGFRSLFHYFNVMFCESLFFAYFLSCMHSFGNTHTHTTKKNERQKTRTNIQHRTNSGHLRSDIFASLAVVVLSHLVQRTKRATRRKKRMLAAPHSQRYQWVSMCRFLVLFYTFEYVARP